MFGRRSLDLRGTFIEACTVQFSRGLRLAAPKAKAAKVGTYSGPAGSTLLNAVRDREAVSWKAKRDKERSEALWLWQELLETWPKNLAVIGQLMKLSCCRPSSFPCDAGSRFAGLPYYQEPGIG